MSGNGWPGGGGGGSGGVHVVVGGGGAGGTGRAPARQPRARRDWYRITNRAADDEGPVEVFIYDEIDSFWGVSADVFVRELAAIDAAEIVVRINSPGGNAYDGIAITNSLRSHPAHVTAVVDGLAASAASFIAMAGDDIIMRPNSEMMIHSASGLVLGDAEDMRRMAEQLDRMTENAARIYHRRAGGDLEDWRAAVDAETWYSAEEAVAAGLADRVEAGEGATDPVTNAFDLSAFPYAGRFTYAGRAHAPAPPLGQRSPRAITRPAAAEAGTPREDGAMPTLHESLAERLGTAADADEDTILHALDEALAERAEDTPAAAPPGAATPEQIAASAAGLGLVLVDSAQYEATVAAAAEGRTARQQQLAEADDRTVSAAIQAGKVAPARKAHWLQAMAADREGATQALAALPDGLIPVEEIGHAHTDTDAELAWFGETSKGA